MGALFYIGESTIRPPPSTPHRPPTHNRPPTPQTPESEEEFWGSWKLTSRNSQNQISRRRSPDEPPREQLNFPKTRQHIKNLSIDSDHYHAQFKDLDKHLSKLNEISSNLKNHFQMHRELVKGMQEDWKEEERSNEMDCAHTISLLQHQVDALQEQHVEDARAMATLEKREALLARQVEQLQGYSFSSLSDEEFKRLSQAVKKEKKRRKESKLDLSRNLCVVCCSGVREVICVPCYHVCLCLVCSTKMNSLCPLDRKQVTFQKIYT
eukprot:TRINITY_DN16659_c0_g1_i1.p1 TRINITY_DN16659_c0_g1~~TRINITY_DN16659_c0_g1_i1.p1  ORF type:complete len:304 (-),score=58.57 TRINITY_DN16659_c0_g1_i1:72-869(-)